MTHLVQRPPFPHLMDHLCTGRPFSNAKPRPETTSDWTSASKGPSVGSCTSSLRMLSILWECSCSCR